VDLALQPCPKMLLYRNNPCHVASSEEMPYLCHFYSIL